MGWRGSGGLGRSIGGGLGGGLGAVDGVGGRGGNVVVEI